MTLATGTRLGPYEIVSPIGAGGMGEVYRARDTHLGRDVAIKVLPEAFAQDRDRLARFEREARTLATLSHTNIAAVFGLEKSSGRHALAMELVEGPTLADRISSGPLTLHEAVQVAEQIADALSAAHEHGIIHRDLKPSNVKVREDGVVKVLDFGLAKSVEPAAVATAVSLSPTITTPAMTQMGMVLGTAAYMSPEQAKGRTVDKRSDVWAFGCVFYEMLTGRRAFDGDDTSDTLASILKSDPDWTRLGADVPAAIRTLIQRCLVKAAHQRVADLSVASFVLAESRALEPTAASPSLARTSRWRAVMPVAATIVITALLVGLAAWSLRPPPPDRPVMRFSFALPELLLSQFGQALAISPDGQRLVYVANGLHIRDMSSEWVSRLIPGTESALSPAFSPDGESIAFVGRGGIRRMALSGGASVLVCATPSDDFLYSLSWDASGIVFVQGRSVGRCPADGGTLEKLAMVDANEFAYGPQILPGGEAMIFTIIKQSDARESLDAARIIVQSLTTGERRTIVEGGGDARYAASGHLLYTSAGDVLAAPFDLQRQVVTGSAVSVIDGVRRGSLDRGGQFVTSLTGHLVYVPGPSQLTSRIMLTLSDRAGAVTPMKLPLDAYVHVRASRDGKQLALGTDNGREADVSIYDFSGTNAPKRLTFGGRNQFPIWSPGNDRIAFQSDRDGERAIFAQRVDGTGLQRLTKPDKGDIHVPESWSPDGKHIAYSVQKGDRYSLWIYSVADGQTRRFSSIDSLEPTGADFSPDGKWIAYHSLPPGGSSLTSSSGVFVEPFPGANARHMAPKVTRDFQPLWSRDGTELFYVSNAASGELIGVPVSVKAGVTFGTPKAFPFVGAGGRLSGSLRVFDVLPDGRFVGLASEGDSRSTGVTRTSEIRVVLNWFEELKRLAPTR